MAGLATLAAVPRSAGSERDADQARCDRCLRAVTHGHAEICSAARSQCGEPRPGTEPADPAACTLCPWRGQDPDLARHCARVKDRRSRTGSPAVTATYRRGKAGVATAPGEAGPGPRPVDPKPRAVWIGSSRRPTVRYRRSACGHRRYRVLEPEPTTLVPDGHAGRLGTPACPKRPSPSPRQPPGPGCPPPRERPDPRKRPGIPPRRTRPQEPGSGHQ
jgi:hypothetical protein